jgi:hypothetical protein
VLSFVLAKGANQVPPLPAATAAVKGKLTPVQGSQNQLSFYTPEIQSHIIFVLRKRHVFFSSTNNFASLLFNDSMIQHGQAAIEETKAGGGHPLVFTRHGVGFEQVPAQAWVSSSRSSRSAHGGSRRPVEVPPTSVPSVDGASNAELLGANPAGFEHGVRYGGHQATRFNSSLVDDDEADARTEWRYQRNRQSAQPAAYAGP